MRALRPDVDLLITVSIDGPPALHDRIRGREGASNERSRLSGSARRFRGCDLHRYDDHPRQRRGRSTSSRRAAERQDSRFPFRRVALELDADLAALLPERASRRTCRRAEASSSDGTARRGMPRNLVELMELAFLINLEFYRRGEPTGIVCQRSGAPRSSRRRESLSVPRVRPAARQPPRAGVERAWNPRRSSRPHGISSNSPAAAASRRARRTRLSPAPRYRPCVIPRRGRCACMSERRVPSHHPRRPRSNRPSRRRGRSMKIVFVDLPISQEQFYGDWDISPLETSARRSACSISPATSASTATNPASSISPTPVPDDRAGGRPRRPRAA